MEILSQNGGQFRTKLLTRDQASRFAKCLTANARFGAAEVCESTRAKSPDRRFFVAFAPSNPERREAILTRQQDARTERALGEGSEYVWMQDKDGGRAFLWLLSTSGEVYEVDPGGRSCSCPDFTYRCRPAGLRCKHLIALSAGLGELRSW